MDWLPGNSTVLEFQAQVSWKQERLIEQDDCAWKTWMPLAAIKSKTIFRIKENVVKVTKLYHLQKKKSMFHYDKYEVPISYTSYYMDKVKVFDVTDTDRESKSVRDSKRQDKN